MLFVLSKEIPGAVGAVEKMSIKLFFSDSTHGTWEFFERNPQHLDVTWTFIARRGPCDLRPLHSFSVVAQKARCYEAKACGRVSAVAGS